MFGGDAATNNKDDSYDWPVLFYSGRHILKMSGREFWAVTPRTLHSLLGVHISVNTPKKKQEDNIGFDTDI